MALVASLLSASAQARVSAKAPTQSECTKQARAATAAVKKRFTTPSYPSFKMSASAGKNVWYIAPSLGTGYALSLSQGVKTPRRRPVSS
jgi:Tfp pilus assembly protein FimV